MEFVGLTPEGSEALEQIQAFVDEVGISWPNAYGVGETLSRWKIVAIPAVFVVGRDRRLVWVGSGGQSEQLAAAIEKALGS